MGDVVLKPVRDLPEAAFVAEVSARLPMVATPVPTVDGGWVHDGWAATRWVDARPDLTRWDDVLGVGDELHAALAALAPAWPAELAARDSPWAVADRAAWREAAIPAAVQGLALDVADQALEAIPVLDERPAQVIHGDLAGNVLFPEARSPVVIDLSPYRRPVAFATAITVLDQVCWQGAPATRASRVGAADLARAVVYRVVAAALHSSAAGEAEATRAPSGARGLGAAEVGEREGAVVAEGEPGVVGDLPEVPVGIGERPGVAAVERLGGCAGDRRARRLRGGDDGVDLGAACGRSAPRRRRRSHSRRGSGTPASAASFVRLHSTSAMPPAWKNTVSSTSWPRHPSAS